MEDVNELCLAPFRSVLREANMAIEKARSDEAMRTAARMLCVAGEFALEQLEPPCARRYKDHDKRFIDALRNNGEVRELRKQLHQQLYVFHRHMMGNEFNADKYKDLETATSDVCFKMREVVINMNLDAAPFGQITLHPSLVKQLAKSSPLQPLNYPAPVTPPCTSIDSSPSTPPGPLPGSPGPRFRNSERFLEYADHQAVDAGSVRHSQFPSQPPSPKHSRPTVDVEITIIPDRQGRPSISHPTSQSAADCAIDGASSFHLLGGFCKGAERVTLGVPGVRKPRWIADIVGSHTEAQCVACNYEVPCKEIEEDDGKQVSGNKKQSGIRYRLRFLRKSHVRWKRVDNVLYACVFCVRAGRTIDPSDPTVFISTTALFLHIARHNRPLSEIPGFVIIEAPTVPPEHHNDYDLHFPEPPLTHPVLQRERHIASQPKGVAKELARRIYNQRQLPDKSRVLEVLVGARVTGLEWPDKYKGEWCSGWHDGVYGSVPFDILQLEPPSVCDVQNDGTSGVKAKARFKFSHKDKKKTGWLKFEKNEIITNISWVYPEHWCWTGTNSKGDRGIFPKAFVANPSGEVII